MRRTGVGWCLAVVAFVAFLFAIVAPPISAQAAQQPQIRISGIISGTMYAQDATFATGNGQRAEYVLTERDDWVAAGDVRNVRLTFGLSGPEISRGWRVSANVELDFFGNLVGAPGNFQDEQPEPRLRLAYAEISSGRTAWRVGQDWSLTLGNIPVSTSHIGFPLGWGPGGFIGWRFMGVKFLKTLSRPNAPTTTRLQLAAMSGSWANETATDEFSSGERTLQPQIEGRVDFSTRTWSAYVVAHVDQKDSLNAAGDDLTSWAFQGGYRTTRGPLTVHGNAYVGRGMGHHFGQIIQFGDLGGWGGWAQVGYTLNNRWSVWGYYGTERPTEDDINDATITVTEANGTTVLAPAARRLRSWLFVPMIRYASGPYSIGAEWLHSEVRLGSGADLAGNQVALSFRYDF